MENESKGDVMRFLSDNKTFLALLIPFIALPWITIGNYHLLLFNFSHDRLEVLGFAHEIGTYALIALIALLGISVAIIIALTLSRFYCGTLCPNTFFAHILSRVSGRKNSFLSKLLGFILLGLLSFTLAFSVIAYGISAPELINALRQLTFAGWLVIFLSLLMIAEVFMVQGWYCAYLCPYGAICAILPIEDRLTYAFEDPENHCTDCGGCVKICPIPALDIREGFDIRCIQCGLCESACEKTFAKSPITSLIHHDKRSVLQAGGKSRGIMIAIILITLLTITSIITLTDAKQLDSCRLENIVLY
ncbi:MAG: 4Fe-4S binding protein [Sulfuricurvum sp.]|nr:4Fe-4S binding protein [Sulfuricurvum sp.]